MSRILFLGTGAADWFRPENGRYRRHASALIDGHIMIDCTESALEMLDIKQIPYEHVDTLLITHSHSDHFSPAAINRLIASRMDRQLPPLNIICDKALSECVRFPGAVFRPVTADTRFHVMGASFREWYDITPLPANHTCSYGDKPWHYLFEQDGLTFLYGTDGAWMTNDARLVLMRKKLDAWIVDYTVGDEMNDDWRIFEHNTPEMVRFMRRSMIKHGMIHENAPVICTHMARTLHSPDASVEPPFVLAEDGMEIELKHIS